MKEIKKIRIDLTPELREISRPCAKRSGTMNLLAWLAETRQTSVSTATLRVYSKAMSSFEPIDIQASIEQLAARPRGKGETAFPDLGTILATLKATQDERSRKTRERSILQTLDDDKRRWLKEREEDIAQGKERKPLSPELQRFAERIRREQEDHAHTNE